jgi:hypothetical protein
MAGIHLWNPWSSRCWPCDSAEERALVTELEGLVDHVTPVPKRRSNARAGGPASLNARGAPSTAAHGGARSRLADDDGEGLPGPLGWARSDLTCVLTALRAGARPSEIFSVAPGLDPAAMVAAYHSIDALRIRALRAWNAICANPTSESLELHGAEASKLMPVPVARLFDTVYRSHRHLAARVVAESVRVAEFHASADRINGRLHNVDPDGPHGHEAVMIGRQLFNPAGNCLYSHSHFLPRRVGELSPVRVGDLLGERRHDTDTAVA